MASGATMWAPGATTSGLATPSWVMPRLENARDRVVAGIERVDLVGRADGDHVRVVARGVLDGVGRVAAVARGGDDDDAGVPGELDGRVERVVEVGGGRVRAHREVDDADVELVLVLDGELQRAR